MLAIAALSVGMLAQSATAENGFGQSSSFQSQPTNGWYLPYPRYVPPTRYAPPIRLDSLPIAHQRAQPTSALASSPW